MSGETEDRSDSERDFSKCDPFKFEPPPEVLVFRPDEKDFEDPIAYIRKIRPVAEEYGICRIVPPAGWRPPFSLNMDNFTFSARQQHLKELDATTRVKLLFLQNLSEFWRLKGQPMKIPIVEGRMLDLYKLKLLVEEMGGLGQNWSKQQWRPIADSLELSDTIGVEWRAASHYETLVHPYVQFLKEEVSSRADSLCGKVDTLAFKAFCQRLLTFWRRHGVRIQWPLINKRTVDLFTLYHLVEKTEPGEEVDWWRVAKEMSFDDIKNGAGSLKHCYESVVRPFVEGEREHGEGSQLCVVCGRTVSASELRVCRECRAYCHSKCLTPGPKPLGSGKWTCDYCISVKLNRPKEPYGFQESYKAYTLKEFGENAVRFKEKHFGLPPLSVPVKVVENEYWRLLSSIDNNVMVEYGADVYSLKHATGFPTRDDDYSDDAEMLKYATSKWNLNNIPVTESSAYSHIGTTIRGVTTPWMYIGSCFSTFCWHIEDHWSYSINYLHWGEPKTWYSIPSSQADQFESIMKELVPELIGGQPDLLHDLSTTLNPNLLTERGLSVYRTDQNAGEFVVTFPRAYHAGFNQGFNFAEAVNFAPADWIPIGRKCIDHYASLFHVNVFSHDELICQLASDASQLDESLREAALADMTTMLIGETAQRKLVQSAGVVKCERVHFELMADDARQCSHCKATCYLSAVECSRHPKLFCLKDFDKMEKCCSCPSSERIFKYKYTTDELFTLIKMLHSD